MKKVYQIITVVNMVCLMGLTVYLLMGNEEEKTAFFMSSKVYNEFELKKELEQELQFSHNESQRTIDSLELDLKMFADALKGGDPTEDDIVLFDRKKNTYLTVKMKAEENYTTKVEESYAQIWDRINEYSAEFGEENDYDFIFGANGDGSVMYAKETKDITDELITYINNRYAGV